MSGLRRNSTHFVGRESFEKGTVAPETFSPFEGDERKTTSQKAMTLQSGRSQKVSGMSVGFSMLNRRQKFRCGYPTAIGGCLIA